MSHASRSILAALCLCLSLAVAAPAVTQEAAAPQGRYEAMGEAADVFDEIARTVHEKFYDPALRGVDWPALTGTFRPRFLGAAGTAERRDVVNEMLGALQASHTQYFTPDQPAYYELADLFSFSFRERLRGFFPQARVSYSGIGAYTSEIGGRLFVSGLLDGLPADRAGLRLGDEILSVDGVAYQPIESFRAKQGMPVAVALRRKPEGPIETISVTPEEIRPGEAFASAIEASARIIEAGGMKLGYVHMWCYFGDRYHRLLERLVATKLRDADALILDLRGGWGGTADNALSIFNPRQPTLEFSGRSGRVTISNPKWTKPAAMLIDGGSRSAKEIIAYGFKKYGIGELIGSSSAKAVLGSSAFMMKDGSLLLLATGDVRVDGERLEGVGVSPTIAVDAPLPYRDGADPQLDRAIAVLSSRNPP